jgi:hypothetical protein
MLQLVLSLVELPTFKAAHHLHQASRAVRELSAKRCAVGGKVLMFPLAHGKTNPKKLQLIVAILNNKMFYALQGVC